MLFENLQVHRIVVHEVFKRNDDATMRQPAFASALESLSEAAMTAFCIRLTDALSGQSQSLEMVPMKYDSGSFLDVAEGIICQDEAGFLIGSMKIATKLAEEQRARRIPGGMLIVFTGSVGTQSVPFFGVVKAEVQEGFRKSHDGAKTIVEFVQNIFLTPATRLYKIGLYVFDDTSKSLPEGRRAFIFDSNISASNREAAATYFYEGFLGCTFPSNGAYETARFFDLTKEYVRSSPLSPEKKRDLIDSLFVFVRDEQAPTFAASEYGTRFLPPELRDSYRTFLDRRKLTPNSIIRDTTNLQLKRRKRRMKFGADIELSASPQAFEDKITIESISAIPHEGDDSKWTRITVKESFTGEQ